MGNVLFFVLMGLAIFCMYNVICIVLAKTEEEREEYAFRTYVGDFKEKIKSILGFDIDEDDEDFINLEDVPSRRINIREGPIEKDLSIIYKLQMDRLNDIREEFNKKFDIMDREINYIRENIKENEKRLNCIEERIRDNEKRINYISDDIDIIIDNRIINRNRKFKDDNFKVISIQDFVNNYIK